MTELAKSPVIFRPEDHTYWLGHKELYGITSTLIHRAFPHKYDGIDKDTLREAARKGTILHEAIAFHDRFGDDTDNPRILSYDRIKAENKLKVLENEYIVSDLERYATAIDIVMENERGEIILVDTKSTYYLDKQSTALQLTINRRFFEMQNPDLKVAHIYVLWLPNKDVTIAEFIELSPYDEDTVNALMLADAEDKPFTLNPIPEEYPDIESELRHWEQVKEQAESSINALRDKLMTLMVERNIQQIKSGWYTISYVSPKTMNRFDSAAFKKDNEDLYKKYVKPQEVKASLRLLKTKQE